MTSIAAKFISKKLLGETLQNNFGKDDPYFEQVPATRIPGKSKKMKRMPKAAPPGISKHDEQVLTKVKRRAYRLDMSLWNCCGIRFGWSSVIGIIPGIGDIIDAFMAMMVLRTCEQVEGGLPSSVKSKMMFNIILDFGIGLMPIVGDLLDAVYRANTRNAVELERHLMEKGQNALRATGQDLPRVDPTDPDEFDRLERESNPPPYNTSSPPRISTPPGRPTQQSQRAPHRSGGSWFGRKTRQPDVENGGSHRV